MHTSQRDALTSPSAEAILTNSSNTNAFIKPYAIPATKASPLPVESTSVILIGLILVLYFNGCFFVFLN